MKAPKVAPIKNATDRAMISGTENDKIYHNHLFNYFSEIITVKISRCSVTDTSGRRESKGHSKAHLML